MEIFSYAKATIWGEENSVICVESGNFYTDTTILGTNMEMLCGSMHFAANTSLKVYNTITFAGSFQIQGNIITNDTITVGTYLSSSSFMINATTSLPTVEVLSGATLNIAKGVCIDQLVVSGTLSVDSEALLSVNNTFNLLPGGSISGAGTLILREPCTFILGNCTLQDININNWGLVNFTNSVNLSEVKFTNHASGRFSFSDNDELIITNTLAIDNWGVIEYANSSNVLGYRLLTTSFF